MWAIYKKELKSYFLSPIGYFAIGIFLIIFSGIFFYTTISYRAYDMGNLYFLSTFAVPFMAAIITMRMFAEERKNGTEQLLLTSPRSMTGVIFGKFLAALTLIVIVLLFSLIYYAILCFFKAPNLVTTLVTILGYFLVSMTAIAVGMFISSITEQQAISAIISFVVLFLPMLLYFLFGIDIGIFNFLIANYQKFPAGLISINEVVNLLATTIMFILFTIIVMQRRKSAK